MATIMKTPGTYVQELSAFGNAVVAVPTAVPAFIGYTQQAISADGRDLTNVAVKISSFNDFTTIFGSAPPNVQFGITRMATPATVPGLTATLATATANSTALKAKTTAPVPTPLATTPAAALTSINTSQASLTAAQGADTVDPTLVAFQQADLAEAFANYNLLAAQADPLTVQYTVPLVAAQKALSDALAADPQVEATVDAAQEALDKLQGPFDALVKSADFSKGGFAYYLSPTTLFYRMYNSIQWFYDNGGGTCYIVSIGGYDYTKSTIVDNTPYVNVLNTILNKEDEPTMVVIPDAVEMRNATTGSYSVCYDLQSQMLNHCGTYMNRVAILDIPGATTAPVIGGTSSVDNFRNAVAPTDNDFYSYGAAYYPWINTGVNPASNVNYKNIDTQSPVNYANVLEFLLSEFTNLAIPTGVDPKMIPYLNAFAATPFTTTASQVSINQADAALANLSTVYPLMLNAVLNKMNLMPPSPAIAGLYTSVDNNQGVWIAPANIAVQSAVSPAFTIDDATQEDLNIPIDGKSICAIRAFKGRGVLVWGARTLDGNSNDWRYINVRRTLIYIEQSIKDAAFAYVFAPNVSSTWVNVSSMISSFLTGLWAQGGLVGPKASDSFSVMVGLGSTMTQDDIENGIMRVEVKIALSHPAEFIMLTFQQQQQTA
jgi:phage tail sheath protein FI